MGDAATTIQTTLPDQLAKEAEQAGLLSQQSLEKTLRQWLKSRNFDELLDAMDQISAVNDLPCMSPEEVVEEIKLMRAEQRALKTA